MCKRRWRNGAVATGIVRRAQGHHFRGSLEEVYLRLSGKECPGGAGVASDLLVELATRLDIMKEASGQGTTTSSVGSGVDGGHSDNAKVDP